MSDESIGSAGEGRPLVPQADQVPHDPPTVETANRQAATEQVTPLIARESRHWKPELIIQAVQTVAILAAGAWAYFLYVTFQKDSNALAIEAARLNQQQATLNFNKTKLELQKTAIDIDRLSQTPLESRGTLNSHLVAGTPDTYVVTYDYSWTNRGTKATTISPVMVEAFYASLPAEHGQALMVNEVGEPGMLEWTCLSRRAHIIASRWKANVQVTNGSDSVVAERGGGGTAELNSGDTAGGKITMLVTGHPTDFVGFRIRYSVGDGRAQVDRRRLRTFSTLRQTDGEKE